MLIYIILKIIIFHIITINSRIDKSFFPDEQNGNSMRESLEKLKLIK